MQKDYKMGELMVFSDGGEAPFPEADKLEKILNNSFSLTADQFMVVKAISEGTVDTSKENIEISATIDVTNHYLFQPGQKAREPGRPPFRDCIQVTALDYLKQRMHRYYIRAKSGDAAALERLMSYFRPLGFIKDLREQLENGAQIVEIPHERSAHHGPRRNNERPNGPRRQDEAHYAMGDRWPGRENRANRNGKNGKDRRFQCE